MVRVFLGPFQFQILENVRSYVNDKLQPVQHQAQSAYYVVTLVTDRLFNNPIGKLALISMESTVSTVHNCIDYYIPPLAGDATESSQL